MAPERAPLRIADDHGHPVRVPMLAVVAGLGAALVSVPLAAVSGPPYLSLGDVNAWIVVFAVGLFAALFGCPFVIERLLRASRRGGDERWERALVLWGAVALAVLVPALAIGLAGGFSGDSLAGAIGIVAGAEALLVIGALAVVLLSG